MFNKIKAKSEVLISLLLGLFFVLLGVFVLFNTGRIRGDAEMVDEDNINTILDLINAFFVEVSHMLGIMIGGFPVIAGILLILFGVFMFKVAQTVRDTTKYDIYLSFFFLGLSLILFIITTVLMNQVYGLWSILFFVAFIVHMMYNVFNEYLDPKHRKEHYMIILFFYGIAYFFTQNAVYSNIESTLSPTDVLSIDMFFVIIWLLSLMSLSVGVFLSKSKNLLKKPKQSSDEQLSRKKKRGTNKLNPNEYLGFSQKLYDFRNRIMQAVRDFTEIDFPKWFKVNYIELLLGIIVLFFIIVEFNNRQGVFTEGLFRLSHMQYIYEWVNLFIALVLAVLYLIFTIFILWKNKFYHRQMIIITALWLKVTVSLYITLFKDVELSLFILPFNILLVVLCTPLLLISIFKSFGSDNSNG
jgi:hypothetical protein